MQNLFFTLFGRFSIKIAAANNLAMFFGVNAVNYLHNFLVIHFQVQHIQTSRKQFGVYFSIASNNEFKNGWNNLQKHNNSHSKQYAFLFWKMIPMNTEQKKVPIAPC